MSLDPEYKAKQSNERVLRYLIIPFMLYLVYLLLSWVFSSVPECPSLETLMQSKMPSGRYCFTLENKESPLRSYIDFNTEGKPWIQLHSKDGLDIIPSMIQINIIGVIGDIGISDNITTMNVENSWIIRNAKISCEKVLSKPTDYPVIYNQEKNCDVYFSNLLKGLTPTGTNWNQTYKEGYLYIEGLLDTYGNWTKMYEGVEWESYLTKNSQVKFRSGGSPWQEGEFIHSNGKGYNSKDHSVTSKVNWNNSRVLWFRPKSIY